MGQPFFIHEHCRRAAKKRKPQREMTQRWGARGCRCQVRKGSAMTHKAPSGIERWREPPPGREFRPSHKTVAKSRVRTTAMIIHDAEIPNMSDANTSSTTNGASFMNRLYKCFMRYLCDHQSGSHLYDIDGSSNCCLREFPTT